jgi:hypothetical protein
MENPWKSHLRGRRIDTDAAQREVRFVALQQDVSESTVKDGMKR